MIDGYKKLSFYRLLSEWLSLELFFVILTVAVNNDPSFCIAEVAEQFLIGSEQYLKIYPSGFSWFLVFVAGGALRSDCKTLVSRPEVDDGC